MQANTWLTGNRSRPAFAGHARVRIPPGNFPICLKKPAMPWSRLSWLVTSKRLAKIPTLQNGTSPLRNAFAGPIGKRKPRKPPSGSVPKFFLVILPCVLMILPLRHLRSQRPRLLMGSISPLLSLQMIPPLRLPWKIPRSLMPNPLKLRLRKRAAGAVEVAATVEEAQPLRPLRPRQLPRAPKPLLLRKVCRPARWSITQSQDLRA